MQKQIFKPQVFEVPSKSDPTIKYIVTNYRPNRWTCTCKDWIYRSKDEEGYSTGHKCKHIKDVIQQKQNGEI